MSNRSHTERGFYTEVNRNTHHDDQEDVSLESKKENLAAAFNMDRVEIKAAGLSGNPLNRRDEVWWW